jgi:hypothetical protein
MFTEPDVSPTELREVLDRQQITQLLYRYCRAVDRVDEELGYTIWHDDGEADYGRVYRGSGRGFIDFVCDAHRRARPLLCVFWRKAVSLPTAQAERSDQFSPRSSDCRSLTRAGR